MNTVNKRTYDNSTREKQRQVTRETIILAMVDAMVEGKDDISVNEIAASAGVSPRTVYVHFPDRDSRIDAINDWIESQVNMSEVLPTSFDDLPDYGARLVDYVLDNEMFIRVQMAPGLSSSIRARRKQPHIARVMGILMDAGWQRKDAKRVATLMVATLRAEAIFDLRDTYGYSIKQIRSMMADLSASLLHESEVP